MGAKAYPDKGERMIAASTGLMGIRTRPEDEQGL